MTKTYMEWKIEQMREVSSALNAQRKKSAPDFLATQNKAESDPPVTADYTGADTP